jgi:hypothetical protein
VPGERRAAAKHIQILAAEAWLIYPISQLRGTGLRKQLDTVVSPKSKLTKPIKKLKATWVEPTFIADDEYRDITSEGLLRSASDTRTTQHK